MPLAQGSGLTGPGGVPRRGKACRTKKSPPMQGNAAHRVWTGWTGWKRACARRNHPFVNSVSVKPGQDRAASAPNLQLVPARWFEPHPNAPLTRPAFQIIMILLVN